MGRKTDLENLIRESYKLIRDYKEGLLTESDPKNKLHSRKKINEQWEYIEKFLIEYDPLVGGDWPQDIGEIAQRFESFNFPLKGISVPPVVKMSGLDFRVIFFGVGAVIVAAIVIAVIVGLYKNLHFGAGEGNDSAASTKTPTRSLSVSSPEPSKEETALASLFEDYDSQKNAYGPLQFDEFISALPDDPDDWYFFELERTATVHVQIVNYVARGQVVVYEPDITCEPPRRVVGNDGRGLPEMNIPNHLEPGALEELPAGRYYVRIYTTGDFSTEQLYHLRITCTP